MQMFNRVKVYYVYIISWHLFDALYSIAVSQQMYVVQIYDREMLKDIEKSLQIHIQRYRIQRCRYRY